MDVVGFDYAIQLKPPYRVKNKLTGKTLGNYNQLALYREGKRINVQRAAILFAVQRGVPLDKVIEQLDSGIVFGIGKQGAFVESYETFVRHRAKRVREQLTYEFLLNEYQKHERFLKLCKDHYAGSDNVEMITDLLLSYQQRIVPVLRTRVRLPRCIAPSDVFTDAVVECIEVIRGRTEVIKDEEAWLLKKSIRLAHKAKDERDRMILKGDEIQQTAEVQSVDEQ